MIHMVIKRVFAVGALALAGQAGAGATAAQDSLAQLNARLVSIGNPSVTGMDTLRDKLVPVIYFGRRKLNGRHEVVDEVRQATGATATVFVRDGDDFLRVSTNHLTPEGKRDVGGALARGPAQAALVAGQDHCSQAAAGSDETGCYHAIKDSEGKVIGATAVVLKPPVARAAAKESAK